MESGRRAPDASIPQHGRRDLLLTVLLFASTLIAYFPAHAGGLLLDDDLHITAPGLRSLGGLWRIWFDVGATQQYYPVLHSAFWLEHRLWGDAVAGYHLVNFLLHAGASCLVVVLMRRLRLPGAWLAAFVFALHPVCVESVAWIAEQKNTLSTVFALGAAVAYLDFDGSRRPARYWLALGLFALALLSKTVVVTIPAALLVVAWWQRGRVDFRRDVLPLLPWFALGAAASLITFSVEHTLLAGVGAAFGLAPVERILLAARALWFYAGELVWPSGLTFFYAKWHVSAAQWWQYLYPAAAVAVAGALWLLARRRRGPLAAFLCFAGTLVPVLGFFNVEWFVFSYVADHLQYLSILCFVVPVAAALAMGAERLPAGVRRLAYCAACGWVAVLGSLTWQQCGRYRDPVTFYRVALALNPESGAAHNNLGVVLEALPGRMPEAIAEFKAALRLSPNAPEGQENLGAALLKDPARHAEAAEHLEIALRLRPGMKSTQDRLAEALSDLPGRLPEAIAQYQASLQIDPKDPVDHNFLGAALMRDPSRLGEAEAQFEEALSLRPDYPEAHNNLGNALRRMPGRLNDAIGEFEEAVRLKPDFAEAHNGLGLSLAQVPGRLADATDEFREAIRLDPNMAGAHSNLGIALIMTPGRLDDAIAELKEAVRLKPDFAPGWHMLGVAWMRSGNQREAADAFREELSLSPGNPAALQALEAVTQQSGDH
jgi:tetratricopeptide (TPR) repeat protein